MTVTQKSKTSKTAPAGKKAVPAAKPNAQKNSIAKKTAPAVKRVVASSPPRKKPAGVDQKVVPAGKKSPAEKTVTSAKKANVPSIQSNAKKSAQIHKNDAKTASRFQHKPAGKKSHTITVEDEEKAHSIHSKAKKNAQVKKNVSKAASHQQHIHAGTGAHIVSDEEKAAALKSASYEAKVSAHNPHMHPGSGSQNVSGAGKTGARKTGKRGFVANLEEETRKNMNFRSVLYTGKNSQLVLMSLKPGEDIGLETHMDVDQFFRFEKGNGVVEIDGVEHAVKDGSGVIVPCGALHNVTNTSETTALKLYTIYSPPEHQDKVIRKTKREALSEEEHFDGKTTEKYQ